MPRRSFATASLVALLAMSASMLSGCVTRRLEEVKNVPTGIAAEEAVVVLPTSYHKGNKTEDGFIDCLDDALQDRELRVHSGAEFVDAMFPYFEPRTVPQTVDGMQELIARPALAERIRERGVRYLVWVRGSTETTKQGGGISCAATIGAAGCIGLGWWEEDGNYEASVWDLRSGVDSGEVSADVHGTSMMPAFIVPVPLIARTQAAACKGLADQLRQFIVTEGAS